MAVGQATWMLRFGILLTLQPMQGKKRRRLWLASDSMARPNGDICANSCCIRRPVMMRNPDEADAVAGGG
jgi:hypothetical protein